MTAPQATPLLLPSDYLAALAKDSAGAAQGARLLDALIETSDLLQRMTDRRFDEYIAERQYVAAHVATDGDLLNGQTLMVRGDLKALISIANGDGAAVSLANVELQPLNAAFYTRLLLDPAVGTWQRGASALSRIKVKGVWGYGGKWETAGFTITLADAATTSFTTSGAVEAGMMLKADSEYLYVETVTGSAAPYTVSVERGYNGATAAAHASAAAYRWRALPVVETLMLRLVQWRGEQKKAPLIGQVTVGDFTVPIDVAGIPADVLRVLSDANLYRKGDLA